MPDQPRTRADIEAALRQAYAQVVPEPFPPWLEESIKTLAARLLILSQMVRND